MRANTNINKLIINLINLEFYKLNSELYSTFFVRNDIHRIKNNINSMYSKNFKLVRDNDWRQLICISHRTNSNDLIALENILNTSVSLRHLNEGLFNFFNYKYYFVE